MEVENEVPLPVEYASYLVRFWRRPSGVDDSTSEWHGEVEHIQTGRKWQFDRAADLLDFLRRCAFHLEAWHQMQQR